MPKVPPAGGSAPPGASVLAAPPKEPGIDEQSRRDGDRSMSQSGDDVPGGVYNEGFKEHGARGHAVFTAVTSAPAMTPTANAAMSRPTCASGTPRQRATCGSSPAGTAQSCP